MRPIRALFWKEWRQMQWRLAFMLTITCIFVFIGLKTRVLQDAAVIGLSFGICAFLIPLFVAMALVAEEHEQGSLGMQLKLPVAAWKVYAVKMMLGALATATPAIACLAIVLIMAGNRESTSADIIRIYGFVIPFEIVFMLWTVVFSMKRRTQWAAALTGISLAALWVFFILIEEMFLPAGWELSLIITPFGFLEAGWDNGQWATPAITQGILAVILFGWGIRRFSMLTRDGK